MTTDGKATSSRTSTNDKEVSGDQLTPMQRAIVAMKTMGNKLAALERAKNEPIAIIGLGCRLPGGGTSPEAFFQALEKGVDGITKIPHERWPADAISSDKPETRWAGLLSSVESFDAAFFGVSPREATTLDPQHRLLLEVVWEALEHAGERPEKLMGSRTGVFVGAWATDYRDRITSFEEFDAYCGTGNLLSAAAGRISYTFGFQGPCLTLDTACSSSLVAVHLACQSLRNDECTLAVAGGVNLILSPATMIMASEMQALSPDGRCKAFDASANGYVRSEGCGIVVLKRLSDAECDGDTILALIRGSAVNQDGRSTGLTTPNVLSQEAMLRRALENAQISAADVGYIELHGTGTPLGDPIEFDALRSVFGNPRQDGSPCVLGAVKTNIGHLETAAGVAGLIKTVLCLQHESIPKNLHFKTLNPRITLENTPFVLATEMKPWKRSSKRRIAGVSSFGASGTNAHVILEEPSHVERKQPTTESDLPHLLVLSTKNAENLSVLTHQWAEFLRQSSASLLDIAFSANTRRTHHEQRLAVVGSSKETLAELLENFAAGNTVTEVFAGRVPTSAPKVAFVFSGQGSQWIGMGRSLLAQEPVFADALRACDQAIQREAGFSIIEEMQKPEGSSRLAETIVAQPALFALEVALAELLQSWDIVAAAVIGHSVGEIVAAQRAGMLDLDTAARLVVLRARIMQKATGKGKMVAVSLDEDTARLMIKGFEATVGIAAVNDPGQVVLSGEVAAINALVKRLSSTGVHCSELRVDYAFHSPQMDPLSVEMVASLGAMSSKSGTIPMYSTVTGERIEGTALDADYWGRNVRQTVRFARAVEKASENGCTLFVEIGPHPVLSANLKQTFSRRNKAAGVVPTLRRGQDERRNLLETLAKLHSEGQTIRVDRLYPAVGRVVPLPAYPWQRQRYWLDPVNTKSSRFISRSRTGHPLLGLQLESSLNGEHFWEQTISAKTPAYLEDHRVQGEVVFPGTGYLELAYAAGAALFESTALVIDATSFEQMLTLPSNAEKTVQVVMTEQGSGQVAFQIASRVEGAKTWTKHARGTVRKAVGDAPTAQSNISPRALAEGALDAPCVGDHYLRMRQHGIEYGPAFRGVNDLWTIGADVLGRVSLPESVRDDGYTLHPALLDACLQVSTALFMLDEGANYVPVGVRQLEVRARLPRHVWVVASKQRNETAEANELACDLRIVNDEGQTLASIDGFRMRRLVDAPAPTHDEFDDCVHEVVWRRIAPLPEAQLPTAGVWLLFADQTGVADAVHDRLQALGQRSIRILPHATYERRESDLFHIDLAKPDDYRRVLREVTKEVEQCRGILHFTSLDAKSFEATSTESLLADLERCCVSATYLVQAITRHNFRDVPRLVLVTRGAAPLSANIEVAQAPLLGLAKTISIEHPELKCTRIDLDPASRVHEADFIVREMGANDREDQIALRGEHRHVARLVRTGFVNKEPAEGLEVLEPAAGRPFQLAIRKPGVLDRLILREAEIPEPARGEVLIKVEAAGMNFLDVLLALGVLPDDATGSGDDGPRLGGECAGRVVAMGRGLKAFSPGDEVIALGVRSFGSYMIARQELVTRKPENLEWAQAASSPIAFLTAVYALDRAGKLRKGERVLIHAGAGGVGLAAIQWALLTGAEVFATAGSEAKRSYLESLGVAHVFDSRSLRFADDIRRVTRGEGIDLVLNSLAGDFIPASLDLLRNHGRFIEIGKRDYYENKQIGLRPFLRNLSFSLVDLRSMMLDEPARVGELLRELMAMFAEGRLKPIPTRAFPISQAVEAFQHMAQAKHIGKIALMLDDPQAQIIAARRTSAIEIYPDRSYLITGGLGGLGLSVARGLVDKGARSIVLVGRRRPNEEAQDAIRFLEERGARVLTMQADVSRFDDVDAVLQTIQGNMPQLGGVVHAAAVLDDHTLLEQSAESFQTAFAAKAVGAWNLHTACDGKDLDFFVMYSSAAALFGSAGQSNYAAANALLDALAHARSRRGLPGMSIQWGPFSEVGMAAAREGGIERLSERGAASFTPDEGLVLLTRLFQHPRPVTGLVRFNLRQWVEFVPTANGLPFFSEMPKDGAADRNTGRNAEQMRVRLQDAPPNERVAILERQLFDQVAAVLRLDSSRFEPTVPFQNLGMDSLMAVELRNRIDATVGTKLPATVLFSYTTTSALAQHVLESIGLSNPNLGAAPDVAMTELQQIEQVERRIAQSLDELTDDELLARLASKLD